MRILPFVHDSICRPYIFLVANKLQFHSASFRLIDDLSIGFCSYTVLASEKRMAKKKEHPCTKLKLYFHGHVRFAIVGQPHGRDLVLSSIRSLPRVISIWH